MALFDDLPDVTEAKPSETPKVSFDDLPDVSAALEEIPDVPQGEKIYRPMRQADYDAGRAPSDFRLQPGEKIVDGNILASSNDEKGLSVSFRPAPLVEDVVETTLSGSIHGHPRLIYDGLPAEADWEGIEKQAPGVRKAMQWWYDRREAMRQASAAMAPEPGAPDDGSINLGINHPWENTKLLTRGVGQGAITAAQGVLRNLSQTFGEELPSQTGKREVDRLEAERAGELQELLQPRTGLFAKNIIDNPDMRDAVRELYAIESGTWSPTNRFGAEGGDSKGDYVDKFLMDDFSRRKERYLLEDPHGQDQLRSGQDVQIGTMLAETLEGAKPWLKEKIPVEKSVENSILGEIVVNLGQNAPLLAASIATRNPTIASLGGWAQNYEESYENIRKELELEGVPTDEADRRAGERAFATASIMQPLEYIEQLVPVEQLKTAAKAAARTGYLKTVGKAAAAGAVGEAMTEGPQTVIEGLGFNMEVRNDKSADEIISESAHAMIVAAGSGGGTSSLTGTIGYAEKAAKKKALLAAIRAAATVGPATSAALDAKAKGALDSLSAETATTEEPPVPSTPAAAVAAPPVEPPTAPAGTPPASAVPADLTPKSVDLTAEAGKLGIEYDGPLTFEDEVLGQTFSDTTSKPGTRITFNVEGDITPESIAEAHRKKLEAFGVQKAAPAAAPDIADQDIEYSPADTEGGVPGTSEREDATPDIPDRGKPTATVATGKPRGAQVEIEYDVIEADDLKGLIVRDVNDAQTRQREGNISSDEQITAIATAPDTQLLGESPVSTVGAPIVDDVVLAGNGRANGIVQGYETESAGSAEYRDFVNKRAKQLGIGDVSGMKKPVLIRRVKGYTRGTRRDFVVESNPKYGALQETTAEAALLDADAIGDMSELEFTEEGNLTSGSLQVVGTKLQGAQRGLQRTTGGKFEVSEATKRVQLAALAQMARDNNVDVGELTGFLETDSGKRVLATIVRYAPKLAALDTDLALGAPLLSALRVFNQGVRAVKAGQFENLEQWTDNRANELVKETMSREADALVEVMIASQKKPSALREVLEEYLQTATNEQQQRKLSAEGDDIFGEQRQAVPGERILSKTLGTDASPAAARQSVPESSRERPEEPAVDPAKQQAAKVAAAEAQAAVENNGILGVVDAAAKSEVANLEDPPQVQSFDSLGDVPPDLFGGDDAARQAIETGSIIGGWHVTHPDGTRTVVMLAQGIAEQAAATGKTVEQRAREVARHEIVHDRKSIGALLPRPSRREYRGILEGVFKRATPEQVQQLAELYGENGQPLDPENPEHRELIAEEILARAGEAPRRPSWFDSVIAAIANVFRKLGWMGKMSDAELRVLLARATQGRRGTSAIPGRRQSLEPQGERMTPGPDPETQRAEHELRAWDQTDDSLNPPREPRLEDFYDPKKKSERSLKQSWNAYHAALALWQAEFAQWVETQGNVGVFISQPETIKWSGNVLERARVVTRQQGGGWRVTIFHRVTGPQAESTPEWSRNQWGPWSHSEHATKREAYEAAQGGRFTNRLLFNKEVRQAQVFSEQDVGHEYEVRSVEETRERILSEVFNGEVPISPEATAAAWQLASQWANPATGELVGRRVEAAGGNEMAGGIAQAELMRYARALTAAGQPSLEAFLNNHSNLFKTPSGGNGVSGAAALLRGRRILSSPSGAAVAEVNEQRDLLLADDFGDDTVRKLREALLSLNISAEEILEALAGVRSEKGETLGDALRRLLAVDGSAIETNPLIQAIIQIARRGFAGELDFNFTAGPKKDADLQQALEPVLANIRDFLINKGASGLERDWWQGLAGPRDPEGPLWTADKALQGQLSGILKEAMKAAGIVNEEEAAKLTDAEKVAMTLGKSQLRGEKIAEVDKRVTAELEAREAAEIEAAEALEDEAEAEGKIEEIQARYAMLRDAWEESTANMQNRPVSEATVRRMLHAESKAAAPKNSRGNPNTAKLWNDAIAAGAVQGLKDRLVAAVLEKVKRASASATEGLDYGPLEAELRRGFDMIARVKQLKAATEAAARDVARKAREAARPELQGQALVNQFARIQSDTPELARNPKVNEVRRLFTQAVAFGPAMDQARFVQGMMALGVTQPTAQVMFNIANRERMSRQVAASQREVLNALERGSLRPLVDLILSSPPNQQLSPEWRQQAAREYFENSGLSPTAAAAAAVAFDAQFANRLATAREKAAERIVRGSPKWQQKQQNGQSKKKAASDLERIRRAVRAGVTDPDSDFAAELARDKGWKGFSPEQHQRLAELDGIIADPNTPNFERVRAGNEILRIARDANIRPSIIRSMAGGIAMNILSGLSSIAINITSPFFFGAQKLITDATVGMSPRVAFRGMMQRVRSWWAELINALRTDSYSFGWHEHLDTSGTALEQWLREGWAGLKRGNPKAMVKWFFGLPDIVRRIHQSLDQAAVAQERDYSAMMFTSDAMKASGLSSEDVHRVLSIAQMQQQLAFQAGLDAGMSRGDSRIYALEEWRHYLSYAVGAIDDSLSAQLDSAALREGLTIVGRRDTAPNGKELSEGTAVTRGFDAIIGSISRMEEMVDRMNLTHRQKEYTLGVIQAAKRMIFGFIRVPWRVTQHVMGNMPLHGAWRAIANKVSKRAGDETPYQQTWGTIFQEKQRMRELAVNTALLAFVASLFQPSDEPDEKKGGNWISVTGKGPANDDPAYKQTWQQRNKPWSLRGKLFGLPFEVNLGRGAESFLYQFAILAAVDDYAVQRTQNKGKQHPKDLWMAAEMAGNYASTMWQRTGLGAQFSRTADTLSKENSTAPMVTNWVTGFGKNIAPLQRFVESLGSLMEGKVDMTSVSNVAKANVPYIGPFLSEPALNFLGDKIDDDVGSRIYKNGIPFMLRTEDTPSNRRVYGLILDKGQAPSRPSRKVVERVHGPLSDAQWRGYMRTYGRTVKEGLLDNYDGYRAMPAVEFNKALDTLSDAGRDAAARSLELTRK